MRASMGTEGPRRGLGMGGRSDNRIAWFKGLWCWDRLSKGLWLARDRLASGERAGPDGCVTQRGARLYSTTPTFLGPSFEKLAWEAMRSYGKVWKTWHGASPSGGPGRSPAAVTRSPERSAAERRRAGNGAVCQQKGRAQQPHARGPRSRSEGGLVGTQDCKRGLAYTAWDMLRQCEATR